VHAIELQLLHRALYLAADGAPRRVARLFEGTNLGVYLGNVREQTGIDGS
jgi:hypothetical protein